MHAIFLHLFKAVNDKSHIYMKIKELKAHFLQ